MDTPIITGYYRENDPMKRLALLEQSIQEGETPEADAVRKELWNIRYADSAEMGKDSKADGYLGLWMSMEFNKGAGNKFFGAKSACKELRKHLEKLKFKEFQEKGGIHAELLYRECCHLARLYMELCATDRAYNTTLCGIMSISKDKSKEKLKRDMYETAVLLPQSIKMEEELAIITKAAREMYELQFPGEGGL